VAGSPTYPELGDDAGVEPRPGPPGMPRWVKVFLVIAIVLALAFIVSRLLGLQHGPGLHNPGGSGGHTASMEQGVETATDGVRQR
jgi:hypothetical protein